MRVVDADPELDRHRDSGARGCAHRRADDPAEQLAFERQCGPAAAAVYMTPLLELTPVSTRVDVLPPALCWAYPASDTAGSELADSTSENHDIND